MTELTLSMDAVTLCGLGLGSWLLGYCWGGIFALLREWATGWMS